MVLPPDGIANVFSLNDV